MNQKPNFLFSTAAKAQIARQWLLLVCLLVAITTGSSQSLFAQCVNQSKWPDFAFSAPLKGAGPSIIVGDQYQLEYNEMYGALAGSTFQSTASIAGTWITVYKGSVDGILVAQGTTPLDWIAPSGGTYFIHYNTDSDCGVATINMTTTIEYTAPPTISNFSPASGSPGTVVTITGSSFNTTPANNIVRFGSVKGTVTAASANSLTVTVPVGATYAQVSVLNTASGRACNSLKYFVPTFPSKASISSNDFMAKVDFASPISELQRDLAIGDLDGDGKPDLVVSNYDNNSISVYRNTAVPGTISAGSFAAKVDFATASSPTRIAIGDLDGDGKLDLAVVNEFSSSISLFRNTSTSGTISSASFASKVDFNTGGTLRAVAISDLDGDGKPELISVKSGSVPSISVFRNTAAANSAFNSASFAAGVSFPTGTSPYSIETGDFDGDGKVDLAVVNRGGSVSIFHNTSSLGSITSESLASKIDFTVGADPQKVTAGDLDGDGKTDLAVANFDGKSISILRNTATPGSVSSSSFADKVDIAVGASPYTVAIGDLDGDGKPDLAVSGFSGLASNISVFRNVSASGPLTAGSFATKVDFAVGANPTGFVIGDLDGDGKADMAVSGSSTVAVSVLRNKTSGVITFDANGGTGTMASQSISLGGSANISANTFTRTGFLFVGWNTLADGTGTSYAPGAMYTMGQVTATLYAIWRKTTITSFTPEIGNPGTLVTITGAALDLVSAVTIGGKPAIVVSKTSTSLVAMVMPEATTGSVSVTNAAGSVTAAASFKVTSTPYPVAQQTSLGGEVFKLGRSVALSADGNTAIVGSQDEVGSVWFYTRTGGVWSQQGTPLYSPLYDEPSFGASVSISADGNTAIVGSPNADFGLGENGIAYIMTRSNGVWSINSQSLLSGSSQSSLFGSAVSISADGKTAVVGASNYNGGYGAAFVFNSSNGFWDDNGTLLIGYNTGTNPTSLAHQGSSVSISANGNTVVVGGPNDNNNAGAAWVFNRAGLGSAWIQQGNKLTLFDYYAADSRLFGKSVSISADGNKVLLGGFFKIEAYNTAGILFLRTPTGQWIKSDNSPFDNEQTGGYPYEIFNDANSTMEVSVSLSADGNTAMIGSDAVAGYTRDRSYGYAAVASLSGGVWKNTILFNNDLATLSLSANGNTGIIGAPFEYKAHVWAAAPKPGVIGNAHTVVFPRERDPDFITNVVSPDDFWGPQMTYSWQYGTDDTQWNDFSPAEANPELSFPEIQNEDQKYFRRGVSGPFGGPVWSNSVKIKMLEPNGVIRGKVVSGLSPSGTGVKGVKIRIRKINDLPGSPKEYEYKATTGNDGGFSFQVYIGDVSELTSGNIITTPFKVVAEKPGVPLAFEADTVRYPILDNIVNSDLSLVFFDKSGYNIKGKISQTCAGCLDALDQVSTTPVVSYLNDVFMYSNSFYKSQSFTENETKGSWAVNVPGAGIYRIRPQLQGRKFVPDSATVSIVNADVSNINFVDTTTRVISGRIGDGCKARIGTATLEFRDVLRDKNDILLTSEFRKRVTTDNTGAYSIRLPARLYQVKVIDFAPASILLAGNVLKDDFINFFNTNAGGGTAKTAMPYDSLLADISNSNTTLNLWYHRPPQMVLNLAYATCKAVGSPTTSTLDFISFYQSKPKPYQVKVYEGNKAGDCLAKYGTVIINTDIQQDGQSEERKIRIKNDGIAYDTLIGGTPNILPDPDGDTDFLKQLIVSYTDPFLRSAPPLTPRVAVLGVRVDNGNSFTTVSPELPLVVLHDPPGDRSYSFWETNNTIQTATSSYFADLHAPGSKNKWAEIKLGFKFESGFGVTTESSVWGLVNGSIEVTRKVINADEQITSFTTSQTISTSGDPDVTGDEGDLFIGAAINQIYAKCYEVKLTNQCKLDTTKNLMIANDGFATQYVYTEAAIRDNVIPTLRAFATNGTTSEEDKKRYATQVSVWEQVLANNKWNKLNSNLDKNISFFGSSGPIQNSTESFSSSSSTIEYVSEIDSTLAIEFGLETGGAGRKGGYDIVVRTETGRSENYDTTKTTKIGYVLDDDDGLDNFSVNVRRDPVYNTPVFQTVAGQSSCPGEEGTLHREQPTLKAESYIVSTTSEEAIFKLKLGSLSSDIAPRTYSLSFDPASNPDGATVSIGGIPMGLSPVVYSIGPNRTVPVTVNVKRNPASNVYSYEGLKFTLTDACPSQYGSQDLYADQLITKTVLLNANFQTACVPMTLVTPYEGWLVNSATDILEVKFNEYNIASVQQVEMEYVPVNSSDWITGFTKKAIQLTNSPNGTTVSWLAPTTLADGEYYIRMKMTCTNGGLVYTPRVKGRIDRTGPVVLGTPQPSDKIYSVGDEISFSYNENINTQNLNQGIASLKRLSSGGISTIPISVTGFANKLVVVSSENLSLYSVDTLRLVVTGVEDVYGNKRVIADTLDFSAGTFIPNNGDKALKIAATTPAKTEGSATPIEFTFTLPKKPSNDVQINFLAGGTALYQVDDSVSFSSSSPLNSFDGSRGIIILPKYQLSVTLKVYPKLDALQENPETVLINLAEGGDYEIGSNYQAMATILDNSLAAPTITGPAQFCPGGSTILTANHPQAGTSGYSFLWSTGATTPTITVSQAGSYTVKIKQSTGAEGTSSAFALGLYTLPTVSAGADLSITQGSGNFPLGGSPTGGVWSGTGVTGSTFNTNLSLGVYELKYCVTTAEGCTKCDTLVITLKAGNPGVAATPQFSVAAGTYAAAQTVSITTTTPGASIYYTTTGNTPVLGAGFTKLYTGPVSVTQTTTLKAMTVLTGLTNSAVATAAYTITTPSVVATPVISVPTGSYASAQFVTLTTATAGASIYYTTSGNTPVVGTSYTKLYSATPFQITASATVRAIAVKTGMTTSATAVSYITIAAPQISLTNTPVISPATGTYAGPQTVTITCSTPGAQIWYTTSGNVPRLDVANGFTKLYTAPFVVSQSTTIRAVALKTNWLQSGNAVSYCTIAAARQAVAADEQEEEVPANEGSVSIYPNPSSTGIFQVDISGSDSESRFDVTGVDGRIIQQGEWNTNTGQLDLSSYPTGMYLLKIVQQDRIIIRRLIKM